MLARDVLQLLLLDAVDRAWKLGNEGQIVSRHHHGGTLAADIVEEARDIASRLRVEIAGGLVGQDNGWVVEQGAGYDDTLLLAARQGVGHPIPLIFHADLLENLTDTFLNCRLFLPPRSA